MLLIRIISKQTISFPFIDPCKKYAKHFFSMNYKHIICIDDLGLISLQPMDGSFNWLWKCTKWQVYGLRFTFLQTF